MLVLHRKLIYQYKLGKDNLYTSTRKFVMDKLMMQVGIA